MEMMANTLNSGKLSDKEVEGGDGLRTLECLRGRLTAERQSSKLAKERVEKLGSKLMELEKEMKMEIKMREKAEKKLKFLMKKLLQSLNISTSFLDSVNSQAFKSFRIASTRACNDEFTPKSDTSSSTMAENSCKDSEK